MPSCLIQISKYFYVHNDFVTNINPVLEIQMCMTLFNTDYLALRIFIAETNPLIIMYS